MPFLMVNLDDRADVCRAMEQLRRFAGPPPGPSCDRSRHRSWERRGRSESEYDHPHVHEPLGKRLMGIRQRGVWKHLLRIARLDPQPRSLPELDQLLEFPNHKMRSLKAIMAKMERRMGLQFLVVDPQGSQDAAGNPRYVMPGRVRRLILEIAKKEND